MMLNQHSNEFREQAWSCSLLSAGLLPRGPQDGGKSGSISRFQSSCCDLEEVQRGHVKSRFPPGWPSMPQGSQVFVDFQACFTAWRKAVQGVWSTAEVDVMFRLRSKHDGPKQRNQSWLIPLASRSPALYQLRYAHTVVFKSEMFEMSRGKMLTIK